MKEVFVVLLLLSLLCLAVLVPALFVLSLKYRSYLKRLLKSLPPEDYEALQKDSQNTFVNFKNGLYEILKSQYREPTYLKDLITGSKYVSFELEPLRNDCEKWFRRYKLVFHLVVPFFLFLCLSALGIAWWHSRGG